MKNAPQMIRGTSGTRNHTGFWRLALSCLIGSRKAFGVVLGAGLLASVFGVLAPFLQKHFIDSLWVSETTWGLLGFVVGAFLCALAAQVCTWVIRMRCAQISIDVQERLSRSIYQQTMFLHPHARTQFSVGELVTFYAQDVSAVGTLSEECLPNVLASFLPLVVAPLAIGWALGTNLLLVFGVAIVGVVVCFGMAWRQAALFVSYKQIAQDRMGIVNEWLQNLKLLRVSGRIEEFESKILDARLLETKSRMDMVTNASIMNGFSQLLPQLINLAGLLTLVWAREPSGRSVTPGEIFGLIWILGVFLGMPLRQLPWALVNAVDGLSSLRRIDDFLGLPRVSRLQAAPDQRESNPSSAAAGTCASDCEGRTLKEPKTRNGVTLSVRALTVVSSSGNLLLDVQEFDAAAGELIAVVGAVGAGKSLFFQALTGDVPANFGRYDINGRDYSQSDPEALKAMFSLVPQNGFVMNADLRRNVGLDYGDHLPSDQELLEGLRRADFDPQAERMTAGLDTPLGERGVNLSGGQRQRLSLARANQFDRPIVLLDDSLSAVDVATEKNLVRDLIQGVWQHKTRLLITHRLSILPLVSRVLFLQEGRVAGFARYEELVRNHADFRHFVTAEDPDLVLASPGGEDAPSAHLVVPTAIQVVEESEGFS